MRVYIDPPEGWKYGFPKSVSVSYYQKIKKDLVGWMIKKGYPEHLVKAYKGTFYFRTWKA